MNRREFLSTAAAPALLAAERRPNILWILGDDLGVQLSCYGHPLVRTPNIDRLANEGVRFDYCFTTAPVCSASRSAFNVGLYQTYTGTHNHRSHRTDNFRLPADARLVTERFREAGYFTANVREIAPGVAGTGKTDFNWKEEKPFDGTHWNQRRAGQPFFAQINFQAPHKGPAFVEARKQPDLVNPAIVDLPPYYPDHPVVRDEVANYYDAIQLLDKKVGVVLEHLEKDKLLDNTVIFMFGDNGRCLLRGKQWLYDPGTQIPLIVRYPSVLPKGSRRQDQVIALDITAQSLIYAGINVPKPFHGQALFGGPRRTYAFTARDRCDMTVDRIRAVRTPEYKLIKNFMPERPYTQYNEYIERQYPTLGVLKQLGQAGKLNSVQQKFLAPSRPALELYDLKRDPHEVENLADSHQHLKVRRDLETRLSAWIEETKDQGANPEPRDVIQREEPRSRA